MEINKWIDEDEITRVVEALSPEEVAWLEENGDQLEQDWGWLVRAVFEGSFPNQ